MSQERRCHSPTRRPPCHDANHLIWIITSFFLYASIMPLRSVRSRRRTLLEVSSSKHLFLRQEWIRKGTLGVPKGRPWLKKKTKHQSQHSHQAASIIYAGKVQRGRLAYQFLLRAFDVSASFAAESSQRSWVSLLYLSLSWPHLEMHPT